MAKAWSGGAWTQKEGKWSQTGWSQGGSGNGWHQASTGWWSPQRKPRTGGGGKGQWVGEWVPLAPSQPWAASKAQPQQQPLTAEPKAKAAADAVLIEAQIAQLSASPLFDGYRAMLFKDLEKARKLAIDKRSDAKKLLDLESWVARETKRIETDTATANEMLESIVQRKITLEAETEAIAKLRSRISADGDTRWEDLPEDGAMDADTDVSAELLALAARELDMRRWASNKRKTAEATELTAAEVEAFIVEANRLFVLQQQKRRKIVEDLDARHLRQVA